MSLERSRWMHKIQILGSQFCTEEKPSHRSFISLIVWLQRLPGRNVSLRKAVTSVDEVLCLLAGCLCVFVCLQAMEHDLRRQFQEAVKTEEKRYRTQRDEISKLPKVEQRDALKKLKQDRAHNIALLAEQFKNTMDDHLDQQNVSVLANFCCVSA